MSLLGTAANIITDTADTLTGTSPATPTPTIRTPTPTTRTPTPTTRTPTPTTRTPTPATPAPVATTATPIATTATTATISSASTTSTSAPSSDTSTTNAVSEAQSTSAPASSSSSGGVPETSAPASATANANASTTVIINVNSHSGDSDASSGLTTVESSETGISTGAVVGIVAGAVVFVLLIAGLAFWLYRRRKQKMTPRSPSFDASYAMAPITLPAAEPVVLESYTPSPAIAIHDLNNFDRTVDLDSTRNLDSTLRLDSSAASIPSTKKTTKTGSTLWEDEAILAARIPMEKLIRKELVNEGGHGAVYHGLYRGECVAIKVLLPDKRKDMRQINIFLSEIKMMASVEHPRIVRFVGVAWDALTDLCAVSEFMPGGDLFSLLRRFDRVDHRPQGFDEDKAKIALHVAQALTYLHSLDPIILHRDLKSMNILLSDDWDAKLTDFGVSRKWTVETMTAGVGTRRWMAPEVMMGKHYDTSADIFSFGVVLSELDSHQPPYASAITSITSESGEKVTETALMEMVAMGRVRIEFSSNAPAALVNLGHACVDLNPRARPSAGELHYQLQKILRRYQKYTL
ncbi:TKL protein kinase [Phytophthora nicotianae]|uniref:TKL protein kinase n=1 Tax=Phytophthora nicotianae TaxID=4792 RepID=W2G540_PHYNI|nr:TKL protein kinase [Phytophthora nicotianae]ETL30813.1 TKL protein kinase [Phytophthora nicotianae]